MANSLTVSAPSIGVAGTSFAVTGTVSPGGDAVSIVLSAQNITAPTGSYQSIQAASGAFSSTLTPPKAGIWYVWAWDQSTGLFAVSGPVAVASQNGLFVVGVPVPLGTALNQSVVTEAMIRAVADAANASAITAEIAFRQAGDIANGNSIAAEATARVAADGVNAAAITSESTARANADALLVPLAQKGAASGIAPLDGSEQVPLANLPASAATADHFIGYWNAATNIPALASGVAPLTSVPVGAYYLVSIAGTTALDGNTVWAVQDRATWNGSTWNKLTATGGTGGGGASLQKASNLSDLLSVSAALSNLGAGAALGPVLTDVNNAISGQTIGPNLSSVATVVALANYPSAGLVDKHAMFVPNFSTDNDGGGGPFLYNPNSTSAPNGGTIICPNDRLTAVSGAPLFTGNGATVTFTGVLAHTPVNPNSVAIACGSITGGDDISGYISGTGVVGSLNYKTGAWSLTFSVAPTNGQAGTISYNYAATAGRWFRQISGGIDIRWFGAQYGYGGAGYDIAGAWQAADNYAAAINGAVYIPTPIWVGVASYWICKRTVTAAAYRTYGDANITSIVFQPPVVTDLLPCVIFTTLRFTCENLSIQGSDSFPSGAQSSTLTTSGAILTQATFSGTISGNTLTVLSVASGTILFGAGTNSISGAGLNSAAVGNCQILTFVSGASGGVGTYTISGPSQTVASAVNITQTTLPKYSAFKAGTVAFQANAGGELVNCISGGVKVGYLLNSTGGHIGAFNCKLQGLFGVYCAANKGDYSLIDCDLTGTGWASLLCGYSGIQMRIYRSHLGYGPFCVFQIDDRGTPQAATAGAQSGPFLELYGISFEAFGEAIVQTLPGATTSILNFTQLNGSLYASLPTSLVPVSGTYAFQLLGPVAQIIQPTGVISPNGSLGTAYISSIVNAPGDLQLDALVPYTLASTYPIQQYRDARFPRYERDFLRRTEKTMLPLLAAQGNLVKNPEIVANWTAVGATTVTVTPLSTLLAGALSGITVPRQIYEEFGSNPNVIVIANASGIPQAQLASVAGSVALPANRTVNLNSWGMQSAGSINPAIVGSGSKYLYAGGALGSTATFVRIMQTGNTLSDVSGMTNIVLLQYAGTVAGETIYIIGPMLSYDDIAPYNPLPIPYAPQGIAIGNSTIAAGSAPTITSNSSGQLVFSSVLFSGAVAATTISASGAVSGAGFTAYMASPPAIGGTTPGGGSFTVLSAATSMTVPTMAVNNNSTNAASTAFVLGQVATAAPLMDGSAAVGTSFLYARQDHVHPTDTSRASTTNPTISGLITGNGGIALANGVGASFGTQNAASNSDYSKHINLLAGTSGINMVGYSVNFGAQTNYGFRWSIGSNNYGYLSAQQGWGLYGQASISNVIISGSNISAATSTLASVTINAGGVYLTVPALTVQPSPGYGTGATAAVSSMVGVGGAVSISAGSAGYTTGDIVTPAGVTGTAPTYTVTAVGGVVTALALTSAGNVTGLPAQPMTFTGGTGTSLTASVGFAIASISTTPGALYSAQASLVPAVYATASTVAPVLTNTASLTAVMAAATASPIAFGPISATGINSTPIGATTPSTGAFTTTSASGGFSAPTTGGFSMAALVAASNVDLSKHISLNSAGYGFNVTAGLINYTVPAGQSHAFNVGGTVAMTISSAGTNIVGTKAAGNATAGCVGEVITATATSVALTSGAATNLISVPLTPGDWDVQGTIAFVPAGTTMVTNQQGGINTVSGTLPGFPGLAALGFSDVAGVGSSFAAPMTRVNVASTTTVYLVGAATFSVSTCTGSGYIIARRRW